MFARTPRGMKRPTVVVRADDGKANRSRRAGPERPPCRLRARVALFLLALLSTPARAAGQLPPGEDWRTFETERFRITFPARLETLARRAGARAEHAWEELSTELPETSGGR